MSAMLENNKVFAYGEIVTCPVYSHDIFEERFYECDLKIRRLSESFDIIPITINEKLIEANNIKMGSECAFVGQFRSYNKQIDGKSKLMLTIFVKDVLPDVPENPNHIEIVGFVCKETIYRTTPFNREICDVLLAVNRNFNKSDYIPCIAWGRNARFVKNFAVGDKVKILGRIQSRDYQKKLEDGSVEAKIAYEVSISKVMPDQNLEVIYSNNFDMGQNVTIMA